MARHNRMNMEWTLASCRTPRSNRKMVEDALHRPNSGNNRVSKPKAKKASKPSKKTDIKGSWDHTGDDSSQIAEGEGNESEDGSDDSTDKAYVKGPTLKSRGHLKGRNNKQKTRIAPRDSNNKKTSSVGPPINSIKSQPFPRQPTSTNRHVSDETPTKKHNGMGLYTKPRRESYSSTLGSESDYSSFTLDMDIDDGEKMLNEYNLMISDTAESDEEDDDDELTSDEVDEFDGEDIDDDDDESILEEETDFIVGLPPSEDTYLSIPNNMVRSPSAFSDESDDDNDIYMEFDDPAVQAIINHTSTAPDNEDAWADELFETYFSDEVSGYDGDSDSDATVIEETPPVKKKVSPKPAGRKASAASASNNCFPPDFGSFKANSDRLLCIIECVGGINQLLVMTVEDYYKKADSGNNNSVATPGTKASEELFAYLPSNSQYSASIPSSDQMSLLSFGKNFCVASSDWDNASVADTAAWPQWTEYLVEEFDTLSDDFTIASTSIDTMFHDPQRRASEPSAIPAFTVPITAFRANQNNALSRRNSTLSGVHSSGIKKNAPRKDSSLTPSQRRKSDATHPGRQKTPSPPIPFPVPLEPLFADTPLAVNPIASTV